MDSCWYIDSDSFGNNNYWYIIVIVSAKNFIAVPQLIIGTIVYTIHYILRNTLDIYNWTLVRWYIADFLALIVCVPIFVNIQLFFNVRKKNYITFYEIIFYTLLFTILYEFICPFLLKRMTFDPLDIAFYLSGGISLYFSQKIKFN